MWIVDHLARHEAELLVVIENLQYKLFRRSLFIDAAV